MRRLLGYALLSASVCACSEDDTSGPVEPAGPPEWNRQVTPPADAEAEQNRQACGYQAGALPAETQGASFPSGSAIPVDTILVVMMENRSFDHYFQKLEEGGGPRVDVAPAGFTNPGPDGMPVAPHREQTYCFVDTNHGWGGSHDQVNGGLMDGFVRSNEGHHELPAGGTMDMVSGSRAMGYYEKADIPFYHWLAGEFALGERYFASVLGPTWPNRMFLMAATSFGLAQNNLADADKTLMDYLDLRQVQWKMYSSTTPSYGFFLEKFLALAPGHIVPFEEYFVDAQNGTLPPVAFVEPGIGRESVTGDDEHPPAIMKIGQRFAAEVIDALTRSPQWSRSALFLTYDEHGGLYDHVEPPDACPPDDLSKAIEGSGELPVFDHLGIRVPFFVVSPYAKKRHVSARVYDHTSIARFIEARFVMPALSGRDANAEAPWDMFDFENPPHAVPPTIELPDVDQEIVDNCVAIFGG